MKKSSFLKIVRAELASNDHGGFVCNIISECGAEHCQDDMARELKKWIRVLLEGHATLEEWIDDKLGTSLETAFFSPEDHAKMKQTRLNWIDWMIGFWEEQEATIAVTQEDKNALQKSIDKWRNVVTKFTNGNGGHDCALCRLHGWWNHHIENGKECQDCPIYKDTGERACEGTPYRAYSELTDPLNGKSPNTDDPLVVEKAQAMLNYLIDLDGRCEVKA